MLFSDCIDHHVYLSKVQYNRSNVLTTVDRTSQATKHLRLP